MQSHYSVNEDSKNFDQRTFGSSVVPFVVFVCKTVFEIKLLKTIVHKFVVIFSNVVFVPLLKCRIKFDAHVVEGFTAD